MFSPSFLRQKTETFPFLDTREAAQAAATAAAAATLEKRQRARPGRVPRAPDVSQTRPGR
eukprot:gene7544-biopygen26